MPQFETLDAFLPADAREDRQITFIEGEHDQRTLTFRRLRQRAIGALGSLQRRGLSRGDMLILYLGDNERFVEMFWACLLGGIVPVPLAPGGKTNTGASCCACLLSSIAFRCAWTRPRLSASMPLSAGTT